MLKNKSVLAHKVRVKLAVLATVAMTFGAIAAPAAQAAYPEHPINMIVSYGPGGGTDLVARALAPYLAKYLGKTARIVVVNRPGAGGEIGFAADARSKTIGRESCRDRVCQYV